MSINLITPTWPAHANVHAFTSTRQGGVSQAPYDSLNLGDHVGDALDAVQANRELLREQLALPNEPAWLTQTHSTIALYINEHYQQQEGDAAYTREANQVCAVLTADCLPLLICNQQGTEVAAIHAGWKGLASGVIENTIQKLTSPAAELLVWLGPAAGPAAYEVGSEVREAFLKVEKTASTAFQVGKNADHWMMDLYALARQRLTALGISPTAIYGGEYCTITQADLCYSYRREGLTGRFASLIWLSR